LVVVHDKSTLLPTVIDSDEAEKVLITGLKTVGDCGSDDPPPPPPPQDTRIIVNNRLKTILWFIEYFLLKKNYYISF
jgi:hypothetical protein